MGQIGCHGRRRWNARTPTARNLLRIEIFASCDRLSLARARGDMDPYQTFVELYVRSDHAASGSDAGGHSDEDHHGHAHPGTVLFLFVAIAVGGKINS